MKFEFILSSTPLFMGTAIAAGHTTKTQKNKIIECNKFIYKQIKVTEEKIEKLSRTIYAG